MQVHVAADHRGFALKEVLKKFIGSLGHTVVDHGSESYDPHDDYPDTTFLAARAVSADPHARGIVLCGSGVGVCVAANKIARVRCVLGFSSEQVAHARESDDCTILALAADFIDQAQAEEMVRIFLETPFGNEAADVRRLAKISNVELEK